MRPALRASDREGHGLGLPGRQSELRGPAGGAPRVVSEWRQSLWERALGVAENQYRLCAQWFPRESSGEWEWRPKGRSRPADSGCGGAGRLEQDNQGLGRRAVCDPQRCVSLDRPRVVCSKSASGLEPLREEREEQEEAGGARAGGWLSLERLAQGSPRGTRGDLQESLSSGWAREKGISRPRASVCLQGSRVYQHGSESVSVFVTIDLLIP